MKVESTFFYLKKLRYIDNSYDTVSKLTKMLAYLKKEISDKCQGDNTHTPQETEAIF